MKVKIGESIHVLGTIVAICLGLTALIWQFFDSKESISIQPAYGLNGEFHLTNNGVSQEVEFIVVNEGLLSTVIQRVKISPGGIFPPRVMIDGKFWDGRPFRIEPNQVLTLRFLAIRDFNSSNTEEARQAEYGEPLNRGYLDLFKSFDHHTASEEYLDDELHLAAGHTLSRVYESSFAQDLQKELFAVGRTFDGDNPDAAETLANFPMYVTFGGPCLSYMRHTLSVCAGLEITTLDGNLFASKYIGFGLRSNDLDRIYDEQN